ncbi:alpha/beta hydrolase family protein [Tahibacter amnicola]|uniref:S9 family peptidase n=1 Tax=Tahibacter amnicola TaxID=2976241 RepID=A0ABY6BBS6_9GAMM|nr:S9 family peptidase [Tahibacter amnicola]UXI67149.1 S9 family peptidase [Tahibacter amnicola]
MQKRMLVPALAGLCGFSTVGAEEIPLADFARHQQYSSVQISPTGTHLAVTSVIEGGEALSLISLKDMKGVNIRPRNSSVIVNYDWVGPDRLIYSVGEKRGGIDLPQSYGELYGTDADGGNQSVLFGFRVAGMQTGSHLQKATSEEAWGYLVDELRNDDKRVLIRAQPWSEKEVAMSELRLMDVEKGTYAKSITLPVRYVADVVTDHDGNPRFAVGDTVDGKQQVYYKEPGKDGWELVMQESKDQGRVYPVMFNRDNSAAYFACAPKGKISGLCLWSPKERELKPIWSSAEGDIYGYVTAFDGLDIVAVRSMPGRIAVHPIDKKAPEIKVLATLMQQFAGDDVSFVSATRDGKKVVVLVHGDVNPGEYYLYDVDAGKATFLANRAGWVKPESLATMEPISLKARDGMPLHGYLTKPQGKENAKSLPMVVLVHGGPRGRDTWSYDPEVQVLANRGYAVLQVNFRGSTGYGDAFMHAGDREWGAKIQDDITDATRWAIEQGVADAKRICIMGTSFGGYAALQGAVREPDLYRCTIGDAGIYDLRMMYSRGDVQQTAYGENEIKEMIGEDRAELSERSALPNVDRIKAKVMLIAGGEDKRVPPVHAKNLHMALEKKGVAHEWLYEASEGHGFYNEKNREERFRRILAFLAQNIGNASGSDAAAAPAKPE